VPIWENALDLLSGCNQTLSKSSEIASGYHLPPPCFFLAPQDVKTRSNLFHGWLRMRDLVLYLLASPTCDSLCFSCDEWRVLLDTTAGFWSPNTSEQETKRGNQRLQVMAAIEKSLQRSSISLKLEAIAPQVTDFKEQNLLQSKPPEATICRRILWEVNELNFRQELISLDRQLDTSHRSSVDRRDVLDACWAGYA
ncbi:hypothetical protein BDP27DRAFT_1180022, partial [Rhodocollybia butyracea]